ncbi:MAG: thioredoxin fold domain-containing protein [Nevskia sp.]|nr:thioredoxin fold domain-containing protein [Nevskia sp.]
MKRTFSTLLGLCLAVCAGAPSAADDAEAIKAKVAKALGVDPSDIHSAQASGLFEVKHGHDFAYVTADGKYLLQGDLVSIDTGEQITEQHRRADRLLALKDLGDANMIAFGPRPPMAPKYVVTVFTDIDCPYCRKMHSQIAEYNDKGIELRYAFFPRTGLNTPSYHKAVSVWCAADRQSAFTKAKHGDSVPQKQCDNPVAREYQLGLDLGIRGTPMLVLPDGEIYPGYVEPDELAAILAKQDAQTKDASIPLKPPT